MCSHPGTNGNCTISAGWRNDLNPSRLLASSVSFTIANIVSLWVLWWAKNWNPEDRVRELVLLRNIWRIVNNVDSGDHGSRVARVTDSKYSRRSGLQSIPRVGLLCSDWLVLARCIVVYLVHYRCLGMDDQQSIAHQTEKKYGWGTFFYRFRKSKEKSNLRSYLELLLSYDFLWRLSLKKPTSGRPSLCNELTLAL